MLLLHGWFSSFMISVDFLALEFPNYNIYKMLNLLYLACLFRSVLEKICKEIFLFENMIIILNPEISIPSADVLELGIISSCSV